MGMRTRLAGLAIACWLVGAICAGAVGYLYVQSLQSLVAKSHNPLVCVFRKYVDQSRARSDFVSKHDKDPQRRATAAQAVKSADEVLANLITLPPSRGCLHVLKP